MQQPSTAFYAVEEVPVGVAADFDRAVAAISREAVARGEREVSRTSAFIALMLSLDLRQACVEGQARAAELPKARKVVRWGFHVPIELKRRIRDVSRATSVKTSAVARLVLVGLGAGVRGAVERGLEAQQRTETAGATRAASA